MNFMKIKTLKRFFVQHLMLSVSGKTQGKEALICIALSPQCANVFYSKLKKIY